MAGLVERNQPGKRQDLSDAIELLDVRKTPLLSMLPKGTEPNNTLIEWQADAYGNTRMNGVVDEKDVTEFENPVARVALQGRIQIFERKPKVSRLANRVSDVAGIGKKKEMAKAIAKLTVMIKRDMEVRFGSDMDSQAETGIVGNETRGLGKWIQTAAQADLPVPVGHRTPAEQIYTGTWANFQMDGENIVRGIMGATWDNTGAVGSYTMMAGRAVKETISGFSTYAPNVAGKTSVRTFENGRNAGVLSQSVDVIEGDFGSVEIHASPWLGHVMLPNGESSMTVADKLRHSRRAYILDLDGLEARWNEAPNYRPLEDQGGGPRGLIESIVALVVRAPAAHGKIDPQG